MKNQINTTMIETYMIERQLSIDDFCRQCQISPSTFRKMMANNLDFDVLSLLQIAKAMQIPVHKIFL